AAGAQGPGAAGSTGIPAIPDSGGFAPATVAAFVSAAERVAEEIYPVGER
ncbi:hypothetical protein G6021_08215, partial [Dietzia sp. CW19]|nr:hypothetical protein [Dietzia sp. CW19]